MQRERRLRDASGSLPHADPRRRRIAPEAAAEHMDGAGGFTARGEEALALLQLSGVARVSAESAHAEEFIEAMMPKGTRGSRGRPTKPDFRPWHASLTPAEHARCVSVTHDLLAAQAALLA